MNKEQQDKLWNELSEESKNTILEKYKSYVDMYKNDLDEEQRIFGRSMKMEYECIFGTHNLNPKPSTYEDILKWSKERDLRSLYKKLEAMGDLLLVAKYLNGDWKPDWSDEDAKFYTLGIDNNDNSIKIIEVKPYYTFTTEIVNFEEKEFAEQAVQILGEETIRLASTPDY